MFITFTVRSKAGIPLSGKPIDAVLSKASDSFSTFFVRIRRKPVIQYKKLRPGNGDRSRGVDVFVPDDFLIHSGYVHQKS